MSLGGEKGGSDNEVFGSPGWIGGYVCCSADDVDAVGLGEGAAWMLLGLIALGVVRMAEAVRRSGCAGAAILLGCGCTEGKNAFAAGEVACGIEAAGADLHEWDRHCCARL